MILLFDIGNTHTHVGLANDSRVLRQVDIPTASWGKRTAERELTGFLKSKSIKGVGLCSVVPEATALVSRFISERFDQRTLKVTPATVTGIGIDYPNAETIGPDRLANAVAAMKHYGAPSLVVDFGTAVTFDVINRNGNYVGGIISPGLAAMTDYLHEKTALLPRIKIREVRAVIGKNTEEAMLIGAVHGYRGLIRELICELKKELKTKRLPVIATGGYAGLIASGLPEISAVEPLLTLEGVRLVWQASANKSESRIARSKQISRMADSEF